MAMKVPEKAEVDYKGLKISIVREGTRLQAYADIPVKIEGVRKVKQLKYSWARKTNLFGINIVDEFNEQLLPLGLTLPRREVGGILDKLLANFYK